MKTRYNKSQIMKEAHRLYNTNKKFGWSFGKSLSVAWYNAKMRIKTAIVETRNEEIYQGFKRVADAKRKAEIAAENKAIELSGLSLHAYKMEQFYNGRGYKAD